MSDPPRIYDPQEGEPSYVKPSALPLPPTRVVNIRLDKYDVYGGRNHKGQVPDEPGAEGWLGNPFSVKRYGREALPMHRQYFLDRVERDPAFRAAVLACRGKAIGCFCVRADGTGDCHLRTVVEWIDAQPTEAR